MKFPTQSFVTPGDPWQRQVVLGLLPLLLGIQILVAVVFVPIALHGNADFRGFYAAGYLLRTGQGRELLDYDLLKQVEDSRISPFEQAMPAIHPAYEYLLIAPFTWFSYQTAYFIWMGINIVLLAVCYARLKLWVDHWLLLALMLGFVPIGATLMHGQDSILLLFLAVMAYRRSDFIAGLLIGLGAFKFNVVLPVAVIYLIWKRWNFVAGFAASSIPCALVSIRLVGIRTSLNYLRTVPGAKQFHGGAAMPNLHGVAEVLLGGDTRLAAIVAVVLAILFFGIAWKKQPSLETALLLIPLTSYYLMLHDLALLLLPISLGLRRQWKMIAQFIVPVCGFWPGFAYLAALPSLATAAEENA
jgi:hypothetical protein